MELSYGSRDLRFSSEDGEQEDHHIPLRHSSSSSSSSSNTGIRWGAAGDGPSAPPSPALAFVEKEHMFHKVVTPSDVGKLNRLVIPKQHAERYFPLDASSSDKGLLLSFEDRSGKPWRFRYSYWNSSQSYVMTKGWSRFVKEKRLDAGDTVSFGRGVGEAGRDRLFIDWKRRPESVLDPPRLPRLPNPSGGGNHNYQHHSLLSFAQSPPPLGSWGGRFSLPTVTLHDNHHQPFYQTYRQNAVGINTIGSGSGNQDAKLVYFHPPPRAALQPVLDSVPVIHHQATPKRVRLFGVNLDCPESGSGVGNLLPQHTQYRPIPSLEMRLGSEVDSAAARWSPEQQQSHLDLDL